MLAVALEQDDEGTQTDASDAHHFVGDIDYEIRAEHPAPVGRKSFKVILQPVDEAFSLLVGDPRHEGRLLNDVAHAIAFAGKLG